jgi:hypothetical protein
MTASATGGNGGAADSGVAGRGGDATLDETFSASGGSIAAATFVATGGNGGTASTGTGGAGGNAATSAGVTLGAGNGLVNVTLTSNGGSGRGTAAGGAATSRLTANGVQQAMATVNANGGSGGRTGAALASVIATESASAGTAHATANAVAAGADATALATTQGLDAADLLSQANATGASGTARGTSTATRGAESLTTVATAPVSGATSAQAQATWNPAQGLNFPNLSGGSNGLHAFSFANGAPSGGSVAALLASHPNVAAGVGGGVVFGLGSLGATYGGGATGVRTYQASATYSFTLAQPGTVTLGLLNLTSYGGGFDALSFTVSSGSTTLVSNSFNTLASAQTWFTDHSLSLTGFAAGANTLQISYTLTASGAKGADISYLLSKPPGSLGIPGGPVAPRTSPPSSLLAGLQPGLAGAALASGSLVAGLAPVRGSITAGAPGAAPGVRRAMDPRAGNAAARPN